MKKKELLRILALLLALGILQPITFLAESVQASEESGVFDVSSDHTSPSNTPSASVPSDTISVRTEDEIFAAVANSEKKKIILSNDIVILKNLEINRDLTIDLNGFNLTSLAENVRLIDIKYGHVELTGKGSIVAFGTGGTAVRIRGATTSDNSNYSSIKIDEQVTLFAPNQCGILVAANFNAAYGVSVNLHGAIVARDGITISSNIKSGGAHAPKIHLASQAKITADENEGTAIQSLGYGIWEVNSVEISAATGVSFASGEIHIDNPRILATGYVFTQVGIDRNNTQKLEIESGLFAGQMGIFYGVAPRLAENSVTTIRGGAFNADVSSYLEPGRHLEKNYETGAYVVIEEIAPLEILDDETKLANSKTRLQTMIDLAQDFINKNYTAGNLGDWQAQTSKAVTALKRAITIGKKTLKNESGIEKIISATNSLHKAIDNVQAIGAEIRSELASLIANANAIEAGDYTTYSYRQVKKATDDGLKVLNQEQAKYEDIYSALLDLQINLDLLEIREDSEESLPEDLPKELSKELPSEQPSELSLPLPMPEIIAETPADDFLDDLEEDENYDWDELSQLLEYVDDEELASWENIGVVDMLRTIENWQDDEIEPTPEPEPEPELRLETVESQPQPEEISAPVLAARENLRALLNAVSALNPEDYTSSSYALFADTVKWAGDLAWTARSEEELNIAFEQVNSVYSRLEKTSEHVVEAAVEDAKANLQTMVEAVETLTVNDYDERSAEQFGELQVALAKSKATLTSSETNLDHIVGLMDEINNATTGLKVVEAINAGELAESSNELKVPESVNYAAGIAEADVVDAQLAARVDWSELKDLIIEIRQLDSAQYTPSSYAGLLNQLERAKAALNDHTITQPVADDIIFDLNLAMLSLEPLASMPVQSANYININQQVAPVAPVIPVINETKVTSNEIIDQTVTPSLLMSMMAGAYAGLATYRKSRLAAKKHKHSLA